jgi:CelD/BcsL family acetyltransferase involved in cellulose biosynthesis
VSNYQTGFRYDEDGRFKPGLVSHAQAIQFSVDDDARVYDLLMGDQRFKRSLAKNEAQMMWVVLRRRGPWRNIGAGLRGLARLLTGR